MKACLFGLFLTRIFSFFNYRYMFLTKSFLFSVSLSLLLKVTCSFPVRIISLNTREEAYWSVKARVAFLIIILFCSVLHIHIYVCVHFGVTSYLLNTAKPTHLSPFELYCKEFFNIFFKNLLFLATHSVCAHMHISKCVCMTHKHKCLCIFAFVYFNSRAELCFQAPERSKSVCK